MKLPFGKKNDPTELPAPEKQEEQPVTVAPEKITSSTKSFGFGMPFLKKKTPENKEKTPGEQLAQGMINVRDIIAPSAIEVDFSYIKVNNTFYRTLFVSGYPRFVGANWLSPVINFDHTLDISMFYYPVNAKGVLDDLRRKMTEMEATVMSNHEKGKLQDPAVVAALEDARDLQEQIVKGVEKFFQFSFYITIPADSLEELNNVTTKLESTLGSLLLISKTATLQMEDAFQSTIPTSFDKLLITRNMDTTSLATTFPFTSSDLTSDDGIMYGVNRHNGSLIIFDRFSMENANSVVFAKSGAGKSYLVKLEALRMLVFGAEVIIIDVEEEYKMLCEAVGGDFVDFSANSSAKINPFDLSGVITEGENELGQKLLSLHTLFKLMLGNLSPTEEALLDRALIETYRIKGITADPESQKREPPVMEDLYKVLVGAEEPEARSMADRLEKYIKGSLTGIFDRQSTININNKFTVFSTKNLEDILKPIAFFIILDFVWTKIKKDLKKRILIVEEAWNLLQREDSAQFLYGIAKRARKYYLGLTTISQDVDDFLRSQHGHAIVTNSSIQILLKQHPAAIDQVAETFFLSEGEKRLLLAADKGEGLFFAGANHVAIKVVASEAEHRLITTNPQELLKLREEAKMGNLRPSRQAPNERPVYKPMERINLDQHATDTPTAPQPEDQQVSEEESSQTKAPEKTSSLTNTPTKEDIISEIIASTQHQRPNNPMQNPQPSQQNQPRPQTSAPGQFNQPSPQNRPDQPRPVTPSQSPQSDQRSTWQQVPPTSQPQMPTSDLF